MEIDISPEDSSNVIEATDQDFEAKVLVRSQQIPVLVDFWAPWCEPCKVIGPVLEKLAGEQANRFELVKVNMDQSPMLAQALRIQSIPAVKLFINGAIHNEFMGALPEQEVVRFLEMSLPSEQVEDAVQGLQRLQMGDTAGAQQIFDQVLRDDPKNAVAMIGMSQLLLSQGDLAGAKEKVAAVNEVDLEKLSDRHTMERLLAQVKALIFLSENAQPNPGDNSELAQRFSGACQAALQGDIESALASLMEIVKTDRKFNDDAGRRGMLAVFDLLPPESELLTSYRQQLSNYLFS